MYTWLIRRLIVAALLLGSTVAFAADAPIRSREGVIYSVKDWKELYHVYRSLGKKADGVVAEAFIDKISSLLDAQWDQLPQLHRLAKRDKSFLVFILRQLNEAVPADTAKRIKDHADNYCPAGVSDLCGAISKQLAS